MTVKQSHAGTVPPLTRRTFLEQFGLAGGSALVMSAMRSWDLMAAQAGPRPALSGRPNGTNVIVLGAGISGMTVAYELGKFGYHVSILEARDRVGGVNWTVRRGTTHTELGPGGETQVCDFDEGLYLNGGPGAFRIGTLASSDTARSSAYHSRSSSTRLKRPTSTSKETTSVRWPTNGFACAK
jgi:NAD(P)-binding Rossmann-like domain